MKNKTIIEKLQLTELSKDEQSKISGGMATETSFTIIINITKTKQDTAKNAINNLR